jgi:hypothetical protein
MSVSTTQIRKEYTGNGATTTFNLASAVHLAADIDVYVNNVLKTGGGVDYNLSGVPTESGLDVIFNVAPANLAGIVIFCTPPMTQLRKLVESEAVPFESNVETALDKLTLIYQMIAERVDRCYRSDDLTTSPLVDIIIAPFRMLYYDVNKILTTIPFHYDALAVATSNEVATEAARAASVVSQTSAAASAAAAATAAAEAVAGANPPQLLLKRTVLTNTAVHSYTLGLNATKLRIIVQAGGGGGGGANVGALTGCGGGGSAGGWSEGYFSGLTPGTMYTYNIGNGGAGGAGTNGADGENTNFAPGILPILALGGLGGFPATNPGVAAVGGNAVSMGSGDTYGSSDGGQRGLAIDNGAIFISVTGRGGKSRYGGGGQSKIAVAGTGNAGTGFGSGGSGGLSTGASATGGAGAQGLIIVSEYS